MTPSQFREWRKRHNLKQREIADLLGLKKRIIQYYERGERDGKKLEIPLNIRLACYAIDRGIVDFDGTLAEKKKIGGTTRKASGKGRQKTSGKRAAGPDSKAS